MDGQRIMYAWGANSYGQLGLGRACEMVELPEAVDFDGDQVQDLAGGGGHSMILDVHGKLWASGWNSRGQLGLGHRQNVSVFTQVAWPSPDKVTQVACGWDFTLALTNSGKVWGCGSNVFGQIGLGDECKGIDGFVPLMKLVDVINIACGLRHSLFVTSKGETFGCGSSKRGQLGMQERKNFDECVKVESLQNVKIQKVHCAQNASLFQRFPQDIFLACDLRGDQEDHISDDPDTGLQKITHVWPSTPSLVSCGWTHTVITMENGEVITMGRNNYHQLGSPDTRLSFNQLKMLAKEAKAGSEHCLAISKESNKLYSWGWNEHGSCGNGNTDNVAEPTLVKFPKDILEIVKFCPASGHNLVVVTVKK